MVQKKKVLFVGSFKEKAADGSVGGQMFACRTLVNSSLREKVDFILIDSTAESVPAPAPYKRIPNALARLFSFLKHLSLNKIDSAIIFSSSGLSLKEKGLMVFIARLFKVRVIFAPRSGLILNEVAKSSFSKLFLKKVIRSSDIVLCQGTAWKLFYSQFELGKPDKFKVLINWIDTNKYNYVFEQRSISKKPLDRLPVKLLYLGWLEPYKGILDFLTVFARLLENGYNVEADVYGSGNLSAEINAQINQLGISHLFKLLGWANESAKFNALKNADIFVLPSYAEGMPNALIEAMTAGLPCVSSNVGGVPDLIEHGNNGFIFNPGDVNKLYDNIILLYENTELRKTLGERAHQFTLDNCSVQYAVKYFENLL